jgi:UDP-glucose 4-epimerase
MKKIIVLGSAGNLGRYFLDYLNEHIDKTKFEIIATGTKDEYPFTFYKGKYIKLNIMDKESFENLPQKEVLAVVDFAGILPAYDSKNDPEKYFDINIKGTMNVLNYCKKVKADRIIYTQTWSDLNGYLKEEKPLQPYWDYKPIRKGDHAIYCISKIAAVELMKNYYSEYGLKYFIFRLPNIYLYSPDEFYYVNGIKTYISYRYMIEKAINGEDIELWGNPKKGKDIIYIKDLCQMIFKSLFCELDNGIYNAGTGIKTSMLEQIEGMIKVFNPKGKKSKIIMKPEKRDCDDFVMDITNIKNDLGYKPEYTYIKYLEDYKKEKELNRFIKKDK